MGLFKTAEEKERARAQAVAKKAANAERAAQRRHDESPIGRAELALAAGKALFELSLPVESDDGRTLSDIEAIGWRLQHTGYVHEVSISSLSNTQNQLDQVFSSGRVVGVYVFRRDAVAPTDAPDSVG